MQATPRFTLRPYQAAASAQAVEFLQADHDRHGLLIEPTGAGKSLIIADIVSRLDEPALVFQPSKELLDQNLEKFRAYGRNPAVFSASKSRREIGEITLATIGSVIRHAHKFEHYRYLIIDEAHGVGSKNADSMFMKFLSGLKRPKIIGLTATPYRLSTDGFGGSQLKFLTRTRPRVFKEVVHVTQTGDLFASGWLCPLEYKQVKTGFREDRLRLNSTGADFTEDSVREHFRELNFADQVVRCVERLDELNRGGSLIFTRFVEEAEYVASRIPGAAIVTAKTPAKERERLVNDFRAGRIRHLANVGIFVVGFDYPALANVVLAQPTMSLARYYQMTGRAMRPHPSKQVAYVVDMVGLVEKFGRIEDLRVVDGGAGKWHVETAGERHLTNVYFGEPPKKQWQPAQPAPVLVTPRLKGLSV